jgi:hypothetical protein
MIKNTTTTDAASNQIEVLPNWFTTDNAFTGDEMIDAYFLGKKIGIQSGWDEKVKILTKQFSKNIESAVQISENLYKEVLENNICLNSIYLRSDGLSKFTSLFVADMKDFVSDDFLKVQSIARKYKGNSKNQDIYLSFLFMPYSEKISKDCLTADGYFLSYANNKRTI